MYVEVLQHDKAKCVECVAKRCALYETKHPNWTAEEMRKYATLKCASCTTRPKRCESEWMRWSVIFLLILGVMLALRSLA